MNISAVVLTKNEEKNIKNCLESVSFCDEVVIIDDFSTDRTEKISKRYGAKVIKRKLANDFSKQRNIGLEKALGKWVLFVDADEVVSTPLRNEIVQATNDPISRQYIGYRLKRTDVLWGREIKHGETGSITLLRLALRESGKWRRGVHEEWEVMGPIHTLKSPLMHYPHQTIREFISSVNKQSSIHAQENAKEGKKSSLIKIIFWPIAKFISNFFGKGGFLDGMPGLIISLTMSLHSYLAWSKQWLSQKK